MSGFAAGSGGSQVSFFGTYHTLIVRGPGVEVS